MSAGNTVPFASEQATGTQGICRGMLELREAKVRRQVLTIFIKISKLTQPLSFGLPLHQVAPAF